MAENASDPHGHHDWHSTEYVDDWIARDITRDAERRPVLQKLVGLIPEKENPRVLDVGAGYGLLSQIVLDRLPDATLVCQDFSAPMFKHAKRRLASHLDRVTLVQGDLMTPEWTTAVGNNFDAVVSAIAIHNVRYPERIEAIYGEIAALLAPGGCFLNYDLIFNQGVETQLGWLRDSGLEQVACFHQVGKIAIIGGFKPR